MPSKMNTYIKGLLDKRKKGEMAVVGKHSQFMGYSDQRTLIPDDALNSQAGYALHLDGLDGVHPEASDEVKMQMIEVGKSAMDLINKDTKLSETEKGAKKASIRKLYQRFLNNLRGATADLHGEKDSEQNQQFIKALSENRKHLALFTQAAALISDSNAKKLDAQGHKRRSQSRPTAIHTFQVDGKTCFVAYVPNGRYTDNQLEAMGQTDATVGSDKRGHSTTSHRKKGLVIGNSNMMRMVVGTVDEKGEVTIVRDNFSGPGARMPYKDLGKSKEQDLAVKAITFLNQEEVIQAMAQEVYDKKLAHLTDTEIGELLTDRPEPLPDRNTLVQQYFQQNPLTEVYMQVITAGQGIAFDSDRNKEQFELVKEAMRVFDGETIPIKIQLDKGTPDLTQVDVTYRGRHNSFGVNQLATGRKWYIPKFADRGAKKQNMRSMNLMLDDTLAILENTVPETVKTAYAPLKEALSKGILPSQALTEKLERAQEHLNEENKTLRDLMQTYLKAFQAYETAPKKDRSVLKTEMKTAYKAVKTQEKKMEPYQKDIDACHKKIHELRKKSFNYGELKSKLDTFKEAVNAQINDASTTPEDKIKLQTAYNQSAYLIDSLNLYYSGDWATNKHNFQMQTLVSLLADANDFSNTFGCKSKNDRGERLGQKIAGTELHQALSDDGLYDGKYFEKHKTDMGKEIDQHLPGIQSINHTLNTGVGGGKYGMGSGDNFSDNGLSGKVAKLAKLEDLHPVQLYKPLVEFALTVITGGLNLFRLAYKGLQKMSFNEKAKQAVMASPGYIGGAKTGAGAELNDYEYDDEDEDQSKIILSDNTMAELLEVTADAMLHPSQEEGVIQQVSKQAGPVPEVIRSKEHDEGVISEKPDEGPRYNGL